MTILFNRKIDEWRELAVKGSRIAAILYLPVRPIPMLDVMSAEE